MSTPAPSSSGSPQSPSPLAAGSLPSSGVGPTAGPGVGLTAGPGGGPTVELVREYRFEAAHMLPRVPDGHRCKRLHGHSYKVEIAVAGPVDEETGWLIDFYDMDAAVTPLIEALDHRTLNDLPELDNPTCERLCAWLWTRLVPRLPQLAAITVWETIDARCSYRGQGQGPGRPARGQHAG